MTKQRFGGLGMGQIKGYADGGKVELRKKKKPAKKPEPEMLGDGAAADAGKKLKGRQAQLDKQMKDLGI